MRSRCKNVDITDVSLIETAILKCLKPKKRRLHRDFTNLVRVHLNCSRTQAEKVAVEKGVEYLTVVHIIAEDLSSQLKKGMPPVRSPRHKTIIDRPTGKKRNLTILSLKHQMLDYIVMEALSELVPTLGKYQMASIPGRGPLKGAKAIRRWLKQDKSIKYFLKMDVKKCFESLKVCVAMRFYKRKIRNASLLCLIAHCLYSAGRTLSIGSYLAQWTCNFVLSQLYHFLENDVGSRVRRDKRLRHIVRFLIYMDDILLLARGVRAMKIASKKVSNYLECKTGLVVQRKSGVQKLGGTTRVPMLGWRISRSGIRLSKRNYKVSRRAYRRLNVRKYITDSLARHAASLWGFLGRCKVFWPASWNSLNLVNI